MRTVTLTLDGERPVSWNTFYAGSHWSKRKAEAERVHALVRAALDPDTPPFTRPVHVTVTAYYKSRPADASNVAAKLYEDGLIGWLLVDDSPAHVAAVTTCSRVDRERPRVVIEVREVGQ